MLLVPKVTHGTLQEVKRASAKVVKTLFKTGDVEAAFTSEGFVDVMELRRPIVMHSHKGDGTDAIFPGNALLLLGAKRHDKFGFGKECREQMRPIMEQLCSTEWGTLALTSNDGTMLLWDYTDSLKNEAEPDPLLFKFLGAALRHWDAFEQANPNYFFGSLPKPLWQLPNGVRYVLANFETVPRQALDEPLPPGGLRAIIPPALLEKIDAEESN